MLGWADAVLRSHALLQPGLLSLAVVLLLELAALILLSAALLLIVVVILTAWAYFATVESWSLYVMQNATVCARDGSSSSQSA